MELSFKNMRIKASRVVGVCIGKIMLRPAGLFSRAQIVDGVIDRIAKQIPLGTIARRYKPYFVLVTGFGSSARKELAERNPFFTSSATFVISTNIINRHLDQVFPRLRKVGGITDPKFWTKQAIAEHVRIKLLKIVRLRRANGVEISDNLSCRDQVSRLSVFNTAARDYELQILLIQGEESDVPEYKRKKFENPKDHTKLPVMVYRYGQDLPERFAVGWMNADSVRGSAVAEPASAGI